MKILVSIIIPTYNRANFLKRALASCLSQTFKSFELIIVDDGSTDETSDVVKNFNDSRIRYLYKENEGLPALSRNYGARKAKGKYLAFLDSDDYWVSAKLEKQIEFMENFPHFILSYSQGIGTKGESKQLISGWFPIKSGPIFYPLMFRNFIITSSVCVQKKYFEQAGAFPIDRDLPIAEDLDLWLKLSRLGKGYFFKESLVHYELESDAISNNHEKKFICLKKVIKRNLILNKSNFIFKMIVLGFFYLRKYRGQ